VAQNSVLRAVGYVAGAGLFFAAVVVIARYLGVDGFGNYSFIMAVVSVFQLIADMGVRNIVVRDLAVDPTAVRERLDVARTLLFCLSAVSLSGVVLVAWTLRLDPEVRDSMYLGGVAVIATFYALNYSAVLRAFDRMDTDILGFVLHKVLLLGLILGLTRTSWGLRGVFAATLVSNLGLYLYYRVLVGRTHGRARMSADFRAAWRLFRDSFPLGMAEVLRRITWQVDRLLLTAMGGPGAVGLFSAAYKPLEGLKPLADNIAIPLFPTFSRLAKTSRREVFELHERSLKLLYVLGCPAVWALAALADRITVLIFGEPFRAAGSSLAIVAPAGLLLVPTSIYPYLFTALGAQSRYTLSVGVSLVVNVALDLLLIPSLSYKGGAIASLASEAALFLCGAWMIARLGGTLGTVTLLWRPLVAGAGLGAACYLVKDLALPYVVLGCLGGLAAYCLLLVALQTFDRTELSAAMVAVRLKAAA
jgi:O-antigen/teichoic acid export membrane protein